MGAEELENFRALFTRRFEYAQDLRRQAAEAIFRNDDKADLMEWAADVLIADARQLLQNLNDEISRKQRHSL